VILKTASWFSALSPDHIRIGISRGVPRRFPAGYRMYRRLAPGRWLNSVPEAEYCRRYHDEILAPLDPQRVLEELLAFAQGHVPVLCCFERAGSGQWCHRSIVSAWLGEALGIAVPEHGFEGLPLDQHPLLPQGSLP
jgi:hypothetical protein